MKKTFKIVALALLASFALALAGCSNSSGGGAALAALGGTGSGGGSGTGGDNTGSGQNQQNTTETKWTISGTEYTVKDGKVTVTQNGTPTEVGTVDSSGVVTITQGGQTITVRAQGAGSSNVTVTIATTTTDSNGASTTTTKTYSGDIASGTLANTEDANDTITIAKVETTTGGGTSPSDSNSSGGNEGQQSQTVTKYAVTVTGGTANPTSAAAGETVSITAAAPEDGKTFDKWTTSTEGVTFESENSSMTTFTMPERAVSVTATYKDLPPDTYSITVASDITNGTVETDLTSAKAGDKVWITTRPANGYQDDTCTVTDKDGHAVDVSYYSFIMPAKNVTVSATFTPKSYRIYVISGKAKNSAGEVVTNAKFGETVTIVADEPERLMGFDKWILDSSYISELEFASATSATTTFIMPASRVDVKATYKQTNGFVKVEGGTVVGGDKFKTAEYNETGVFIKDRTVTIPTFYMCEHEVTLGEYDRVVGYMPNYFSHPSGNSSAMPVERVSWYDAIYYCNKRSVSENLTPCYKVDGESDPTKWNLTRDQYNGHGIQTLSGTITCDFSANGYRLPTEAEWEYAARGGAAGCAAASQNYWVGTNSEAELGDYAWYIENCEFTGYTGNESYKNGKKPHYVTEKKPNSLGLYDMTGNVAEMCWDLKNQYVNANDPYTGPATSETDSRVVRGGDWSESAAGCRLGFRSGIAMNYTVYTPNSKNTVGFRVVRTKLTD